MATNASCRLHPQNISTNGEFSNAMRLENLVESFVERLVHRVLLAVAGQQDNWETELFAMAADSEMRRELSKINSEFQVAETDGLEGR
jgi:hypothetical protein